MKNELKIELNHFLISLNLFRNVIFIIFLNEF